MIYAMLYILVLFGVMGLNIVQILKIAPEDNSKIKEIFPSTMTLYDLLDVYKKENLYFRSIFIARRFLVSILYVAMRDYQGI